MEISTEAQLIRMLVLGRVDVIIGTNPNLAYDLSGRGKPEGGAGIIHSPENNKALYRGVKKIKADNKKKEIEKVLKDMIKSNRIKKIMAIIVFVIGGLISVVVAIYQFINAVYADWGTSWVSSLHHFLESC